MINGLTISDLQAMYFDKNALREPAYKLKRVDFEGARWYYTIIEGQIYWSISTTGLISKTLPTDEQLIKWIAGFSSYEEYLKELDKLSNYGTAMHAAISQYILGGFDLSFDNISDILTKFNVFSNSNVKKLRKDLLALAQFCIDKDVEPLAVEIMVFDPDTCVAGTIDLLCTMNYNKKKVTALVDFKSGKNGFRESHKLQLHEYRRLVHKQFPDIHIDMLFNIAPKDWEKTPTYTLKDQTDDTGETDRKLELMRDLYRLQYPVIEPKNIMTFSGAMEFKKPIGDLYTHINGNDFVLQNDEYFKNQYVTLNNGSKKHDSQEYESYDPFVADNGNPFATIKAKEDKKELIDSFLDF